MGILLKFTLKSITEKKFRTFLILLSIALSVALSLASFAMRDVIKNSIVEMVKKEMGTANIMVSAGDSGTEKFVRLRQLGDLSDLFEYQIGAVQTNASYQVDDHKMVNITIRGYDNADIKKLDVAKMTETLDESFSGKSLYVSDFTAREMSWKLGQTVDIAINGVKHKVRITGIGANSGSLESTSDKLNAIMPSASVRKMYNIQDRYFFILLKTKPDVPVNEAIEKLQTVYDRYEVREPVPWAMIEGALNNIIVPFVFMLLLVLATAIFIIYTAFKVITVEKLPVLGTFRSIGATKRTVDLILLGESFLYGLFGALFGILFGRLILGGIAFFMTSTMSASGTPSSLVNVDIRYYLFAVVFGILLSVISSIMPIIGISKLSVRDIVLGFTQRFKDFSIGRTVFGVVAIVIAMIIPFVDVLNKNLLFNLVATILLCAGLIFAVPALVKLLIAPLMAIGRILFGNLGVLSVKNINGNKNVTNNIALLTIGIASILLINILSHTMTVLMSDAFQTADYDVICRISPMSRSNQLKVKNTAGVDGVLPVYSRYGVEIVGKNNTIGWVEGAPDMSFFDYWNHEIVSDRQIIEKHLGVTRSIVLSKTLQHQLGVNVGDTLSLKMSDRRTRDYTIVGIINTMQYNGSYAIISQNYLIDDASLKEPGQWLIKTNYPDTVAKNLRETFKRSPYGRVTTMREAEQESAMQNTVLTAVFSSFSVIAMLIGTVGILNNFIVSLLARQRSLAVMKSVGMSKSQTLRMLTIEALMSGAIGGFTGTIGGILLSMQVNQFLNILGMPFSIKYNPMVIVYGFLAGVIISVFSSLWPSRKVAKMNIVSAIKYE